MSDYLNCQDMSSNAYKGTLLLVALCAIFAITGFMGAGQNGNLGAQWRDWKEDFGVKISEADDFYRMLIFERNILVINSHNSKSGETYRLGLNQFAHLSAEEFMANYGSSYQREMPAVKLNTVSVEPTGVVGDVDWEKLGKVSNVKNQGACDAGYAFCSNSLSESYRVIQGQKMVTLSEQQIIDCAEAYTTFGCQGGSRAGTLKFLQEKGVIAESKYPYKGVKGNCQSTASEFKLPQTLTESNGCTDIANALTVSPLTVAVNIENWQLYVSGIFSNCGSEVQHDIFLVGSTNQYWRLKNSWGTRWGEQGYIRLSAGNTCGICSKPGFGFKN